MGIGRFTRGLVAGRPGWTVLAGLAALGLLVVPQVGASDYLGGGQQADTNTFLNPEVLTAKDAFGDTLIRVPIVQAVTLVPFADAQGHLPMAELEFKFGPTTDYTSFQALLGRLPLQTEPLDPINPQNGARVLNIPIVLARNTVVGIITGTKPSGGRGTDRDRITMICCVPFQEQPPTANAGPDQFSASGRMVTLDGTGSSDPNRDPLTYAWEQASGPPVTLSSASAAKPTFSAPAVPVGTNVDVQFDLAVSDGIWTSFTDRVRVTVQGGNEPPVVIIGPDQVVTHPAHVTLNGSATYDPEGAPVTYAWSQTSGIAVTLMDANTSVASFDTVNPPATDVLTFTLTATDALGASSTGSTHVTVNPMNNPPTVTASATPAAACAGQAVHLDATATDLDNDPLTYLWTQTAGTPVTLAGANSASAGFLAPSVSANDTLTFMVTVSDGRGGVATASASVLVYSPANCPGTVAATGLSVVKPLSLTRRVH